MEEREVTLKGSIQARNQGNKCREGEEVGREKKAGRTCNQKEKKIGVASIK